MDTPSRNHVTLVGAPPGCGAHRNVPPLYSGPSTVGGGTSATCARAADACAAAASETASAAPHARARDPIPASMNLRTAYPGHISRYEWTYACHVVRSFGIAPRQ